MCLDYHLHSIYLEGPRLTCRVLLELVAWYLVLLLFVVFLQSNDIKWAETDLQGVLHFDFVDERELIEVIKQVNTWIAGHGQHPQLFVQAHSYDYLIWLNFYAIVLE